MMQRRRSLTTVPEAPRAPAPFPAARCTGCALRGAELCRAISRGSAPSPCPPPLRRYEKGKLILESGTSSSFFGVSRSGYARFSRMRLNGKRVLFSLAVPGDAVGGLPDQPLPYDLEAATDLEICTYEPGIVQWHLMSNRRFRQRFLQEIDRQHHLLLESVWRYGALNSQERIIAFIVAMTDLMPTEDLPDGSVVLKMKIGRRDWADLTNTAVETISRTLRHLEKMGLLTSISPHAFRLHDPERLAGLAGIRPPRRQVRDRARPAKDECRRDLPKTHRRMTGVNAPRMPENNF